MTECAGLRASCVDAVEAIPGWLVHPARVLCDGCRHRVIVARLQPDLTHLCLRCDPWRTPTT